jgi:hypothetical protein
MTRLAVVMVMVGALGCGGPRTAPSEEQLQLTKLAVDKYGYDAYPSWASSHVAKACPDSIDDLNEYANTKDSKDAWGTPYKMLCGSTRPPGVHGIGVQSAGPDQKFDTDDDIRSW